MTAPAAPPDRPELPILYRDDALVVVNKPAGLLVHRGWANDRVVALTLVRDLVGRRVYAVHRLDRPTSGALLFALDRSLVKELQGQFARREVQKRYVALVRGVMPPSVHLDHPVPRTPRGPRVDAATDFRRLAVFERFSLVQARPHTGRLHQIRRHLKHLSHPIVGDVTYGKGDINRLFRARFGLHRLALHAVELALRHPVDGSTLRVRAPLTDDLAGPFAAMGLPTDLETLAGDPEGEPGPAFTAPDPG